MWTLGSFAYNFIAGKIHTKGVKMYEIILW